MNKRPVEEVVIDLAMTIINNSPDDSARFFFYAEFDDGVVSPNLFEDTREGIVFADCDCILELLLEMNELADPQPIGALALDIQGDTFKAALDYDIKWSEDSADHARAAVKQRFGDKPIIYPNLPRPRRDD